MFLRYIANKTWRSLREHRTFFSRSYGGTDLLYIKTEYNMILGMHRVCRTVPHPWTQASSESESILLDVSETEFWITHTGLHRSRIYWKFLLKKRENNETYYQENTSSLNWLELRSWSIIPWVTIYSFWSNPLGPSQRESPAFCTHGCERQIMGKFSITMRSIWASKGCSWTYKSPFRILVRWFSRCGGRLHDVQEGGIW